MPIFRECVDRTTSHCILWFYGCTDYVMLPTTVPASTNSQHHDICFRISFCRGGRDRVRMQQRSVNSTNTIADDCLLDMIVLMITTSTSRTNHTNCRCQVDVVSAVLSQLPLQRPTGSSSSARTLYRELQPNCTVVIVQKTLLWTGSFQPRGNAEFLHTHVIFVVSTASHCTTSTTYRIDFSQREEFVYQTVSKHEFRTAWTELRQLFLYTECQSAYL